MDSAALELGYFSITIGLIVLLFFFGNKKRRHFLNRRRHHRYQINTRAQIWDGENEVTCSISNLSVLGAQLNTSATLDKKKPVNLSIQAPNGLSFIAVQGRIVWSRNNKTYGIKFDKVNEEIRTWTPKYHSEKRYDLD